MERALWLAGETLTLQVRMGWNSTQDPETRLRWEWTKNGSLVSSDSASGVMITTARRAGEFLIELEVGGASESDSGVYACKVSSSLGSNVVHFEPLTVFTFAVSSEGHPTDSMFGGLDLDLSCRVSVSPDLHRVELVWMRLGGVALELLDHLTVSDVMRVDSPGVGVSPVAVYQSNVSFTPLMAGDEGEYVCKVTCHLGNGVQVVTNHTRALLFDSESSFMVFAIFFMLHAHTLVSQVYCFSCDCWKSAVAGIGW